MIVSARKDKRGHWPRGKRRNALLPERQLRGLLRRVQRVLDAGRATQAELAREVGVSDRSVRRWLRGEDFPSAAALIRVQQWIDGRQG